MMEHFARRPRQVRLMWIASFRLTQVIAESHPLRELRQELRLHRLCDEIPLDPFSESEVSDYLSSRVPGTPLPEVFIRRLHSHTDGLPLFVANVVDSIVNQLPSDPHLRDDWLRASTDTPLPVPDSLTGIVEKQIARLHEDTQAMLSAASVWGMEFSARAVAQIVRRDPMWVIEQCDALVQRQLWLSHQGITELSDDDFDSRYSFRHALYQHVFYHRLPPSQRVQYHRQVVRAIAEQPAAHTATPAVLASHYERGHQPMLAIRQYAEAAEIAIRYFAPQDAESLTARGLRLLQTCKEGPERMDMEVRLMSKRGVACSVLFGVGSQQARIAFERAKELCDALPENPDRALLMNGMGLTLYIRGEYDEAAVLARRVYAMSERHQNPVLVVFASNLLGMIDGVQARHRLACEHLERGLEACKRIPDQVLLAAFVVDPFVSIRANLALPLLHLGFAHRAREQIELAVTRVQATGQPTARMLALWVKGMIAVRREEPQEVAAVAEQLGAVVEQNMLTHGEGPARWLRGWAMAQLGSPREGFKLIREGFACHERHGAFAGNTETLGYAAEALMLAGDWNGAERQLDAMAALARRIEEPVQDCNHLLFRARIATARSEPESARKFMDEALAVARAQASPFYELKALTAICEHPSAGANELQALRNSYAALPEGHDMQFAKRAAALLGHSIPTES
jgi:tetratricopeptide (TPR) repeat protein